MKKSKRFLQLTTLFIIMFFSLSSSFAQDDNDKGQNNDNDNDKITICHSTGSTSNPYVEITISTNGLNGHDGHDGDIIPAPVTGCPESTSNVVEPVVVPEMSNNPCTVFLMDGRFPNVDIDDCTPDTSVLERPTWQAINLAPAVCLDQLFYHSDVTGDWELYHLGGAENADVNLSRGIGVADISPTRSPDGQWIAFMSNRDGNWEIYLSAVYSDNIQRLTYNTSAIERHPVWSPTDGQIIYESNRSGNWDLYIFDVNSGIEAQLTNSDASDTNVAWSQDGMRILFQTNLTGFWQIYEKVISTGVVRLISDGIGNDVAPQYIPNSTALVFRSFRDGNNSAIYSMNTDGSNIQVLSDSRGSALNQSVSPQGTFMAYASNLDGDSDIYIYEFTTERTRLLTNNTINDYAATWYCGNTNVSFDSEITGNPDLFSASVLPIDGAGLVIETQANQLTSGGAQELYPMMSPANEDSSRSANFPGDSQ